jgi:hypothetical protein
VPFFFFFGIVECDFVPCYQVEMTVRVSADLTSACPRGCSGHGQCLQGQCQCSPGYIGQDCALSKYSVPFCLTKTVRLASVAPGTASAFRASASAAPDTSDRTVLSVSIHCFFALVLLRARPVPSGPVPVQPRIHRTGLCSQYVLFSAFWALPYI